MSTGRFYNANPQLSHFCRSNRINIFIHRMPDPIPKKYAL